MRTAGLLASFVASACLAAGCGGSDDGSSAEAGQPKHPDLWGTVHGPHGHSGGPVWDEKDDGYEPFSYGRGADMQDRQTRVVCKPVYVGTTDAGDSFELEVTIGEKKETKEVLYEGKKVEIELADGVKYVMEPSPQ